MTKSNSNGERRISRLSSKSNKTADKSNNPPWDKIIPAIFFAASAACYVEPSKAPSILSGLLGLTTIYIYPVMSFLVAPVTKGLIASSLDSFTADENGPRRERLYESIADCYLSKGGYREQAKRWMEGRPLMHRLLGSKE
ncbi:hypothetical protein ACHAXA_000907 [Cyclostephanos tholiformis]|uniref:Uncharacterized protein n=1 Tax=Cyclostephanos tholiformis TaxID=382380 RepID=A0ABD3RX49_9STRA